MHRSAFLVGLDLGTTNCAVAYVDTRAVRDAADVRARRFEVPQLVAPREMGRRPVLPSFLYFGTAHERETGTLALPWQPDAADAVGIFARDHGALVPSRQVASAKSWLAHGAVDRTAPLLPFGREPDEPGISPLDASARYLRHVRDAWNHEMAGTAAELRLERQQVVLTVPASFDDEARELTAEAARLAGLDHVVLIEEPIAALYAWLMGPTRVRLEPGSLVLVCDVGGGTTDFSLIRAVEGGDSGFVREAIGDHLLLGGDNLDLSLAALVEERLGGTRLSIARREGLRRQCAFAKERLLSDSSLASVALTVLGSGRSVVGGSTVVEITREEVVERLLDGFLPPVGPGDRPLRDRRPGLRELGLPYETEPAITRHLAAFLAQEAGGLRRPDAVLFNGGFFVPRIARDRVVDTLAAWFGAPPDVLPSSEPEAAVALGAAAYAALRLLPGSRRDLLVRAGSPRTYFVELAGEDRAPGRIRALTVMPRGTDEGTALALEGRRFKVLTNRPVAFALYSSTSRHDAHGTVIEEDASALHRHAPLVAVLRYGRRSVHAEVEVALSVRFTEVGTLELWLEAATGHRWRLHFQVRAAPGADEDGLEMGQDTVAVPDEAVDAAVDLVRAVFGAEATAASPPALVARLEERLGFGRQAWPLVVLRRLADALIEMAAGRTRGAPYESRWLNLVGFCLRPGFGASADAWRIGELRKVYTAGLAFPRDVQCQAEWLVLWQRVAGGFSTGQQQELGRRLVASLGFGARKAPRLEPQIERESWRLLASLERLDVATRVRVGDAIVDRLRRDPRNASLAWSLGRVGARVPFYGPLDRVVPPEAASRWIEELLALRVITPEAAAAIAQIGALTGDPARDVAADLRERALDRLRSLDTPPEVLAGLSEITTATRAQQGARYLGESLPRGLMLTGE